MPVYHLETSLSLTPYLHVLNMDGATLFAMLKCHAFLLQGSTYAPRNTGFVA